MAPAEWNATSAANPTALVAPRVLEFAHLGRGEVTTGAKSASPWILEIVALPRDRSPNQKARRLERAGPCSL
jgi:hypothetical protein